MTTQLPAEIAEAIEALEKEAELLGNQIWIAPGDGDAIKSARAALDAVILKHLGGWQPIETGRDQGWVMLFEPCGDATNRFVGRFHLGHWQNEEGVSVMPTHWRPLPEPPATDLGRAALAEEGRG